MKRRSQGTCAAFRPPDRRNASRPTAARTSASAVASRNARSSASGVHTSGIFGLPRLRPALLVGTACAASGKPFASSPTRPASSGSASATAKRASVRPLAGTIRGTIRSRPTRSSASFAARLQAASDAGACSVSAAVIAASRGSASSSGAVTPATSRGASVSSTRRMRSALPRAKIDDPAPDAPQWKKRGAARSGRKTMWDAAPALLSLGSVRGTSLPCIVRVTAPDSTQEATANAWSHAPSTDIARAGDRASPEFPHSTQ